MNIIKVYFKNYQRDSMSEPEDETLITKIQLEYATQEPENTSAENVKWNVGLLYLTNKNLWFVNREKEKTQVSYDNIMTIGSIRPRKGFKLTKFSKILGALNILDLDIMIPEKDIAKQTIMFLAAPLDVLNVLKNQIALRANKPISEVRGALKLSKNELLRRLAVLFSIEIRDDAKLKFFLGLDDKELMNLLLEHSQLMQAK